MDEVLGLLGCEGGMAEMWELRVGAGVGVGLAVNVVCTAAVSGRALELEWGFGGLGCLGGLRVEN